MRIYRPSYWISEGKSILAPRFLLVFGLLPFIPFQLFAISTSPASPVRHVQREHPRKSLSMPLRSGARALPQASQDKSGNPGDGGQEVSTSRKVNRTHARSTADAVLTAYKAKDLAALAEYSTTSNKNLLEKVAAQGENHPRYQSIFSGWRREAVERWQGKLGEIRYKQMAGAPVAQVQLVELGEDKIAVVTLAWEKDRWCFEDINRSDRQRFEKGTTEAPTNLP